MIVRASYGWVPASTTKAKIAAFIGVFLLASEATTDNPLVIVRWLLVGVSTVRNSSSRLV